MMKNVNATMKLWANRELGFCGQGLYDGEHAVACY